MFCKMVDISATTEAFYIILFAKDAPTQNLIIYGILLSYTKKTLTQ